MLNELYDVNRALSRSGIERQAAAAGLEVGRGKEGIRIFLARDGSVSRAPEPLSAEQMKGILKWSTGSGLSLPVYNLDSIYSVSQSEFDRLRTRWAECHRKGVLFDEPHPESSTLSWSAISGKRSRTKDLQSTLRIACEKIRAAAGASFVDGGDGWQALLETLEKQDALQFVALLGKALSEWVRTAACPKCAFGLLYCAEGKSTKTPVQFEPEGVFSAPVYSPQAQRWLTRVGIRYTLAAKTENDRPGAKAGHGKRTAEIIPVWGCETGCTDPYPQNVDSPIGQISFFNRDVEKKPTSTRYDPRFAVFPVGSDKRNELIADFKWLTAKEREGTTWARRRRPRKDGVFLLLAYLVDRVDNTPEHLAELFAGPPEDQSDRAIVQFETVCGDVVRALDGVPGLTAAARIQVFALHKPDGFRAQIFASESITTSALIGLAESWQKDCRAHPSVVLPQFAQGGDETVQDFKPLVPFPYQAISCLNTIWEKCGKAADAKCESASDYGFGDAFELLRRTGTNPTDTAYLGRMLHLAVRRALPLMQAVGQAMHQARHRVFVAQGGEGSALKSRLQARHWPCLLSLLLIRLRFRLEIFMKEPAYLVGRFLAELDRLHAYYAKHVSGKEEGLPQLLGNSLMSVALESPLRGLELAGRRMLPYQAWGYSFARGRKSKEALGAASDAARVTNSDKWEVHRALGELGRIAEELSNCGIPDVNRAILPTRLGHEANPPAKPVLDLTDTLRANDQEWMHSDAAAKAQMLLGYLAREERVQASRGAKAGAGAAPTDFPTAQETDTPSTEINRT